MRLLTFLFLFFSFFGSFAQGPIHTEVRQENGAWQMYRGGEPYYIKGAGGHVYMDVVVANGGNSIRTWGLENAQQVLDDAQAHGLTVMLGLWMAHERHGFDYSDEWAVEDQLKGFRQAVREFKDHPALLMWGVGNEVDLFYSDINVWDATEKIAAMIHEEDPHHPTCAVTAGIDVAEVQLINERAPSIDILGVNTYGAIGSLQYDIRVFGWEGPYVVTEWGPTGHWEVARTSWGAPIEETSTEKAAAYDHRYASGIEADAEKCIGSYVFLWGQKQETTPTWYGVFLEDGSQTPAIDVLHRHWSGSEPGNRAPVINTFLVNGKERIESVEMDPADDAVLTLDANDPDGDELKVVIEIIPESTTTKAGGDREDRPQSVEKTTVQLKDGQVNFKAPGVSGAYRLFVYLYDGKGKAATANFPFNVMSFDN